MYGPGNFMHILGLFSAWVAGFIFFLVWVAVLLLLVRFLLIATRAAKLYLRNNGQYDGLLPKGVALPGATAPAASAAPASPTKPAPKPRTPKP